MLLQLSHFSSFVPTSTRPAPHFHCQSPHCCPCPWILHICSLTTPFTFQSVPISPHLPPPLLELSVCSMILCLWFYFAHQFVLFIRFISEIIRFLSFTDRVVSLNIILYSSIHAVAKGRNSFSLSAAQYSIVQIYCSFFNPLIYRWVLRLILNLGYCKQHCYEHGGAKKERLFYMKTKTGTGWVAQLVRASSQYVKVTGLISRSNQ